MKKFLKIFGISFGALILLIIAIGALVPILFKDQIKAAIDKSIEESVNAKVYYDIDGLSISIFSHFPDITVGMKNFGVIGIEKFENDTLVDVKEFSLGLDIMSVINGPKMKINRVFLDHPSITALVLEDGSVNWDIAKPSEEEDKPEEESAPFSLAVDQIEIDGAHVIYDDKSSSTFAEILGFDHESSVEINSIYELTTHTLIKEITASVSGVDYLKKSEFEAKVDATIDMNTNTFTFKENNIRLNQFSLAFNGWLKMLENDGYDMDVTFGAKETEFKNILSLIPAIFMKDFETLKTSGSLAFDGMAKGTYQGETLPEFNFNLLVKDGFFQYPALPESVKNVNIDFNASSKGGAVENTIVHLKNMHMEIGKNPIDAKLLVKNLRNYEMDADLKASLNLGDIMKIYPVEGLDLKGLFSAHVLASGSYDSTLQKLPFIDASMSMVNGYVKSSEFPQPIENLNFVTKIVSDGNFANTKVDVTNLGLTLDGEKFTSNMHVVNLDDINYDIDFAGVLNLDKLLKIFPLEDMEMGGVITITDFNTKGKMSDVEKENYMALATKGHTKVSNFHFKSADLPQGFKLSDAEMTFDPNKVNLSSFNGFLGKSDIHLNGVVNNYMGYLFSKTDTVLKGNMNFASTKFDVNEWMTDEETPAATTTAPQEEVPMEAVAVPGNINFVLSSKMDKVLYDNLEINNLIGNIIIRDNRITMDKIGFNTLDGQFKMDGFYDAKDLKKPLYKYEMGIKDLDIKRAYVTFESVKKMAPIAEDMEGKFDMDLHIDGPLDGQMNPIYDLMNGKGFIAIHESKVKDSKTLKQVGTVLNKDMSNLAINDQKIYFEIKDGKVKTDPFTISSGSMSMLMSGSSTLEGGLDYTSEVKVPGGQATQTLNNALSAYNVNVGDDIIVDLAILGTFAKPEVKIKGSKNGGGSAVKGLQDDAKKRLDEERKKAEAQAKAELDKQRQQAEAQAKAELDKQKKEAEARAKAEADRLKKEAEEKAKKEAQKQVGNKIKDLKW